MLGSGLGSVGGGDDACIINTHTSLASPNPAVVSTVRPQDILIVRLNTGGATPIVEVLTEQAEIAGTMAGLPHLRTLVDCLQLGVAYEFEVVAISGGRVDGILRNA